MNPGAVLGFAQAAGRLASGDAAVVRVLRRGRAALVVIAVDAGGATVRRFRHLCDVHGVPWVQWGRKAELGQWLGQRPRAVVAVCDPHFARLLQKALGEGEFD
ncbi:MAG TPA: L7Ae/L30e/S12e/Gadd45 family ribosomal protein [Limnochordales bacterium]|nr:L7Ae/L30e/S12e/Gadd45 family ribosomal protein [Limnochordales bacterium]